METIQIQVPTDLAERLQDHRDELPQILEWGLYHVQQERVQQDQLVAVLRQAGAAGPDLETIAQYLAEPQTRHWMPIPTDGKPASELIIGERDHRSWTR